MPTGISFDRVADRYDDTRGGLARGVTFAADIRPWLATGTVLEVGTGTGVVATALAGHETPVVGVDISPLMARQAYERIGTRVALGDARALPVGDGSIGTVLLVMVLHLVGDIRAALAEAARVLRPDGRVVAVHGVPASTGTDLDEALAPLVSFRRHRSDDDDTILRAAEACGLRRVHQGGTTPIGQARTPNTVADEIEERIWSYLWRLTDADWQAQAVPALSALRALPEPDRARASTQWHRLSVFGR